MNWLVAALLAPATYAVVNYVDQYIVVREVGDYRGMPIFAAIMGFVVGTSFWFLAGFPILTLRDSLIVLLTGALTIWATVLYFRAISTEEASKLILFFQVTPILILVLSFIFLNELIAYKQFLGFILVLLAVGVVSIQKNEGNLNLSSSFLLILVVDGLWALSAVLIKYAIEANSFAKILSYESWGIGLGGLILYLLVPSIRNAFHSSIRQVRKVALGVMFLNEGLFVVAKSLTFYAYSLGSAALVSVIGGTQVFFGIIYGLLLTNMAPTTFHEDISKAGLLQKIAASTVLLIGLLLVY